MKYKCDKHGFLDLTARIIWQNTPDAGRWCLHCLNEFLDKFCGKLIEIEDDESELVNNTVEKLRENYYE